MVKLLAVFAVSLVLAYISEKNTNAIRASGQRYTVWKDWAYIALLIVLVLFAGLRTSYNDTQNYISGYKSAPTLAELLSDAENLNPFKNPLFYIFRSAMKSVTDNAQWHILFSAAITQCCFIWFFKRYSKHFLFSIFLYFTLGTFVFTLAALKQVLGMAILTLALPFLEKRKWIPYYLIVIAAMLIHTYAIAFAVLPFFVVRPWKTFTYVFVIAMVVIMMNFKEVITAFMEQANDLGKTLADYELFDDATINVFRLAVYAVTPLLSLLFQKWVFRNSTQLDHVLIHMSIISLAFMSMGTQSGANMFGRMGTYFELGTICCFPKMLVDIFDERSYKLVAGIAVICFLGYFLYGNAIAADFGSDYKAMSLLQLLIKLI